MPLNDVDNCVASCTIDLTDYIFDRFLIETGAGRSKKYKYSLQFRIHLGNS